jgi:hypothetical protein
MKHETSLHAVPDAIFFRDLHRGESDSAELWIHNIGKRPIQIRFSMPPDSPFRLSHNCLPMTAPGLEGKVNIFYTASELTFVQSHVLVESPGSSLTIPISAVPPCPRILPDKPKITLGSIGLDTVHKFSFVLSNIGIEEGEFALACGEGSVHILQTSGKIQPGKSVEIPCDFTPRRAQDYNFRIQITAPNSQEPVDPIEVTATAVQHSLALLVDGREATELDFETIFIGQKRVLNATIVNRGPYKKSFVVYPPRDSMGSGSSRSGYVDQNEEVIFSAVPAEGLLNAYQSMVIRFIFNPPIERGDVDDDLESIWNQYSAIEVVETSQRLDFQLTGKAVHHLISLSAIDFGFDKVRVEEQSEQAMTIRNLSKFLPTTFEIKPIAHFRFQPSKGTIRPGASKSVSVVFFPKSLGVFGTSTTVCFSEGLASKRISLSGASGDKDKPFRRVPVYEEEGESKYRLLHADSSFAYDADEIKRRQQMREEFDAYLTDSQQRRAERKHQMEVQTRIRKQAEAYLSRTRGRFTEEEVQEYVEREMPNLDETDIDDRNLAPPEPVVSTRPVPLYLPNPEKFGLVSVGESKMADVQRKHHEFQDDSILTKKKFKAKATTPAEISDCTRALTPAQQLQVVVSHKAMNFGVVSVCSSVARSFSVWNNLQQNVLVSLKYDFDELKESLPVSQVIPPKQTGGFDIRFACAKPENFMKTIQYTVNGHHTYSFSIQAQVVPIEVLLSRSLLEFRFSPDSTTPVIREFVTIQNKGTSRANISWVIPPGPFSIPSAIQWIEAKQNVNVEIHYSPTTRTHDEVNLTMNVHGGDSRVLKCVGDIGSPKCSLGKKTVAFGLIPTGITKIQQLRLKNSSEDDGIFTVTIPKSAPELQISPMNGRVAARDSQNLQISYKPISASAFDIPVTVSICGSQPLTFNVTGQAELPQVQITDAEFEFGKVFVGSSSSRPATISNTGAIPAVLFLDLSHKPEFRIEFPTDLNDEHGAERKNSITLVSDPLFVTKMEGVQDYLNSTRTEMSTTLDDKDSGAKGLVYKFQILEHTTVTFHLVFQPAEVAEHSFELPLSLMNVVSSSSYHLQPIVSGEAIMAPVVINRTALDFGISPICNPDNPACRSLSRVINLSNDAHVQIAWHFDLSNRLLQEPAVFDVKPVSGTLDPGTSAHVEVTFTARAATPYNTYLPLYVTLDDTDNIVGSVQLTGVGTAALFEPSVREICLPIVPIGVKVSYELFILNSAFIQTLLKIQLAVDESVFPLRVTFPEGNQLLHSSAKLPVLVTFQPTKPINFSTLVGIIDEGGHAASFSVTCTADNSIFTIYPYLSRSFQLTSSDKIPKEFFSSAELTSRFRSQMDFMDLKGQKWEPSFLPGWFRSFRDT